MEVPTPPAFAAEAAPIAPAEPVPAFPVAPAAFLDQPLDAPLDPVQGIDDALVQHAAFVAGQKQKSGREYEPLPGVNAASALFVNTDGT